MKIEIYGLYDPRNDQLRYVGQTSCGLKTRLSKHIYQAKNVESNPRKKNWILKLLKLGLKPKIELLGIANETNSLFLENWFWNSAKLGGYDLLNYAPMSGGIKRKDIIEKINNRKVWHKQYRLKNKERLYNRTNVWRNENKEELNLKRRGHPLKIKMTLLQRKEARKISWTKYNQKRQMGEKNALLIR